jgi:4-alpha-glucanotransferase
MVNTHDMAPFAGFWQDCDLEERREAGLLEADKLDDEHVARSQLRNSLLKFFEAEGLVLRDANVGEIFRACLAHLRDSPARMVLLNLEDLWQETRSQNIPSTSDDSSNWRRKARFSFETFRTDAYVLELLREVNKGFACFCEQ